MTALIKLGFRSTNGDALHHNVRKPISRDEFFAASERLLPDLADAVHDSTIRDLDSTYGRWHPSGFMVFPLGTHPELGTLRLHIWPTGKRQRQIKGRGYLGSGLYDGDIHNHMWHIKSMTLASYQDRFFKTERRNSPASDAGLYEEPDVFRVYRVAYESDQPETLSTDGSCVQAASILDRSLRAGEMHEIEVGQYHAPVLPDDEFGATLVISSFRVDTAGPDVLIGGTARPIVGNRVDVTAQEARQAREQFASICR
jgi:hypothetical protein